jgi:hypothetical protein
MRAGMRAYLFTGVIKMPNCHSNQLPVASCQTSEVAQLKDGRASEVPGSNGPSTSSGPSASRTGRLRTGPHGRQAQYRFSARRRVLTEPAGRGL